MKTVGIFSKVGAAGGSENRVLHLANELCRHVPTYLFAEKNFSDKLKPQLDPRVLLRENTTETPKTRYELSGVDILLVVNSDSYSFCKKSYWDGTQGKHHSHNIDISQIGTILFLFNYVVSPAQNLVKLHKINPNIKLLPTSEWFLNNLKTENKFEKLRELDLPMTVTNSPVSSKYIVKKTSSDKIRINRHSMAFAYKHDENNVDIVNHLCNKHGDKISFKWMGVPSEARDHSKDDKKARVPYATPLLKNPQMEILKPYAITVPELLEETDILFFYIDRKRQEPWPRTIAEAMLGGCCCVTNNNYGMKEQIEHGKTGFLFDNAEQAKEQLDYLIENPEEIKKVSKAAQKYAKEHFLSESVIKKFFEFAEK